MLAIFHTIFGILAFAFFLWRYCRTKEPYQLVLLFWLPSTFLTYLSTNRTYSTILGIVQLLLFFTFLFFFLRARKKREEQARKLEQKKAVLKELEKNSQDEKDLSTSSNK